MALPPNPRGLEWSPRPASEVGNGAFPVVGVPVPRTVAASLNVTAPVGVPEVAGLTVAVKVTALPNADGFAEETTNVEVPALFTENVAAFDVSFEEELKTAT